MTKFATETFEACPFLDASSISTKSEYKRFLTWKAALDLELKTMCSKILQGEYDAVAFKAGSTNYLLTKSSRPNSDIQTTKFKEGSVCSHIEDSNLEVDDPVLSITNSLLFNEGDIEFVCCSELDQICDKDLLEQYNIELINLTKYEEEFCLNTTGISKCLSDLCLEADFVSKRSDQTILSNIPIYKTELGK